MPHPVSEPPVVNSLLLADRVYRDRESGKWVIAGVFSGLTAPSLPTRLDEINVFFQLTNAPKSFDLHLRVEHAESGELMFDYGGPMNTTRADPLKLIEHHVRLMGVVFRSAGKYWIQLVSDEEILAQAPLEVQIVIPVKPDAEDE